MTWTHSSPHALDVHVSYEWCPCGETNVGRRGDHVLRLGDGRYVLGDPVHPVMDIGNRPLLNAEQRLAKFHGECPRASVAYGE